MRRFIELGVESGATLVTGGAEAPGDVETGFFVRPMVFANVDPDSVIAREEIFGPVLCIIPHTSEESALEIANNSRYGLHGSVWSADQDRALAFARRGVRTGQINVNGAAYNPRALFGGYKLSGVGPEMGAEAMGKFTEIKSIPV